VASPPSPFVRSVALECPHSGQVAQHGGHSNHRVGHGKPESLPEDQPLDRAPIGVECKANSDLRLSE